MHATQRLNLIHGIRITLLIALTSGAVTHSAAQAPTEPATTPVPVKSTSQSTVLKPPAALALQNVPEIEQSMIGKVQAWRNVRGPALVGWHPSQDQILVRMRHTNTAQIYSVTAPGKKPQLLTDFAEPVSGAMYQPNGAKYLLFIKDVGGNEVTQIFRKDLDTGLVTQLTDNKEKHQFGGYNRTRTLIAVGSVQIDANTKDSAEAPSFKLRLIDPLKPQEARLVAQLPGVGWSGVEWAPDDKHVLLSKYLSAASSEIYRLELDSGQLTKVLPLASMQAASMSNAHYAADGKGLYLLSDHAGEFQNLFYYDLASKNFTNLTQDIPWDVQSLVMNEARTRIAITVNEDGRSTLRMVDPATQKVQPLIEPLPRGSIVSVMFARHNDEMAFTVNSAQSPGEVMSYDFAQGKLRVWTKAHMDKIETRNMRDMQSIRWKSFDDRTISGLILKPPSSFTGPRPVIIDIHGGPEGQSVMRFAGSDNYVVNALGIAKIWPNVRGSRGYGKTFLTLDDGRKREDSVRDIGALFDWIKTQPDLDASRVMVEGGSYGGYMSLAVSTHYSDRIVGAIDSVGISNFISFLERTETYRRDLRRVEYGDERDPEMRKFLNEISPLTNAHKIKKPLFVVQGQNDPRVPWQEAQQIVEKVRKNNVPVWYMLANNEGHGFAKKENSDYYFYAKLKFYEKFLLQ